MLSLPSPSQSLPARRRAHAQPLPVPLGGLVAALTLTLTLIVVAPSSSHAGIRALDGQSQEPATPAATATATAGTAGRQENRGDRGDGDDRDGRGRGRTLRVASYNIHHGAGNDVCTPPEPTTPPSAECAMNLERIADIVHALDVDIIGLQEIDRFWGRSGSVDQATRLGALLRMNVCYGGNLDHQPDSHAARPHQYGTLILSKRPLLACWNTLLPRANTSSEQRGLLYALVEVPGGPALHVYNTHLHTAAVDRAVQVPAMDALIADATPAIILGDLNAQPTEASLAPLQARFQDAWVVAGTGDGFTIPAAPDAPATRRIDYAFVTPNITVSGAAVAVTPDSSMGADHYPLVVEIKLPRGHGHGGGDDDDDDDRDRGGDRNRDRN